MSFLSNLFGRHQNNDAGSVARGAMNGMAQGAGRAVQGMKQQPVPGQAQVPFNQAFADQYNANPTAPQFSGPHAIDPKYFGYPADETQMPQQMPNRMFQQPQNGLDALRKLLRF